MKLKKVNISDIVQVNPRLPADLAKDVGREVDFVPMAQLSEQGYVDPVCSRPLGEVVKGYTYFANGDVLVAKITPCMENGKAAYVHNLPNDIAFGSTEFHVLRPGPEVDARYLFYMVWNPVFRNSAEVNMTGSAGQKRVPAKFFDRFQIPLPPLSEQKRIADILDKANAVRMKWQQVRCFLEDMIRSQFRALFGIPLPHITKWNSVHIDDVISDIRGGASLKPTDFHENGFPVLHKGGIKPCGVVEVDPKKKAFTTQQFAESHRKSVVNHDYVAVTLRDLVPTGPAIGLAADLSLTKHDKFILAQGAYAFRLDEAQINREYYVWLSNDSAFRSHIKKHAVGSTQIHIRMPIYRSIQIPLPPMNLQLQFSTFVDQIRKMDSKLAITQKDSNEFFNSLIQNFFRKTL